MQEGQGLRLARVFTLTLYALFYRPITALLIAVVTIYLPSLAADFLLGAPPETIFSWESAWWALRSIPFAAIAVIFHAWVAFQVLDGNEQKPRIKEVIARQNSLFITSLLVMVVGLVGLAALILPAILWGLACTVVIPAAAIERLGPSEAIMRSFTLTERHRWSILALSLGIFLPLALLGYLVELGFVGGRVELLRASPLLENMIQPIGAVVGTMLNGAFAAAIYVELMRLHREATERFESSPTQGAPP